MLTRSVADAAFFVGTLSGRAALYVNEIPPATRIGICLTAQWPMALPETQALFEQLPARLAARGARVERACRLQVDAAMGDCDVLVVPSAPGEAPRGIDATGDLVLNRTWSLLRTLAIHVPAGQGPNGLPIGVRVVGRIGDDTPRTRMRGVGRARAELTPANSRTDQFWETAWRG